MNNPYQMLQMLKANPIQFLMQRRFNIPQNLANDPNAILNYLLSSGQVTQQQVNTAYQQMQGFGK
jgi:hypothetical protein